MNATDRTPRTFSTPRRFALAIGWILLAGFSARTFLRGSIAADVRAFQLDYLLAFAGFAVVAITTIRFASHWSRASWYACILGCILLRLPLLPVAPSDDLHRYLWEGRLQLHGVNPYAIPPDDPRLAHLRDESWAQINHPDYPAIYPPVAQLTFLAAAWISPTITTIKITNVLWDVLTIVVLAALLRRRSRPPHHALLYGLCPLVLTAFAVEGHIDSLMLLLVALALYAWQCRRTALAGLILGAAVATKLVPLALVPWFVIHRRRALPWILGGAAVFYIPYLSAGRHLFESLQRFSKGSAFFSPWDAFTPEQMNNAYYPIVAGLLLLGILIALARRNRDWPSYAAPACGALTLLMPIVHYWYFTFVLLFQPLSIRLRWLTAAAALVLYFEAVRMQEVTGTWHMPRWAAPTVWLVFGLTWLVEWMLSRRLGGRDNLPPK